MTPIIESIVRVGHPDNLGDPVTWRKSNPDDLNNLGHVTHYQPW